MLYYSVLALAASVFIVLPYELKRAQYAKCRKKNKFKKNCDNYLCLFAGFCPYSKFCLFDDWSEENET